MSFGFTYLGVVPVRNEAKSSAEQINQLLFADVVTIVDQWCGDNKITNAWLKIRNCYDGYEGWVDKRNVLILENQIPPQYKYIVCSTIAKIRMNEEIITVPMAAVLPDKTFSLNNYKFSLLEGSVISIEKCNHLLIRAISLLYLNTPYQWGGKSIFGLDCSGFTQNVFKFAGVKLQRDAWQQALQGKNINIDDIKVGDLCFFGNNQGQINHVGIYIGNNKIIHCSGRVRIDTMDDNGIKVENNENVYSHHLCAIKNYDTIKN